MIDEPGLAHGRRDVELAGDRGVEEVLAADHRQHLARRRLDHHHRRVVRPRLEADVVGARHHLLGKLLDLQVDRRPDREAAREQLLRPEPGPHELADVVHPVRRPDRDRLGHLERQRRHGRPVRLVRRNQVHVHHPRQDRLLAGLRRVQVDQRVVASRALRQPGQQARLRQRQVARRLPEVRLRGRLGPERPVPVEDDVQVRLQQLVLRVPLVQLDGRQRLLHLPPQRPLGALVGQEQVTSQLHLDSAAALRDAAGLGVRPERAHQPDGVHARVGVVAPVLRRHRGGHQVARHLGERHERAPAVPDVVDLGQERAVSGGDPGRLRQVAIEPALSRQVDRVLLHPALRFEGQQRDAGRHRRAHPQQQHPDDEAVQRDHQRERAVGVRGIWAALDRPAERRERREARPGRLAGLASGSRRARYAHLPLGPPEYAEARTNFGTARTRRRRSVTESKGYCRPGVRVRIFSVEIPYPAWTAYNG